MKFASTHLLLAAFWILVIFCSSNESKGFRTGIGRMKYATHMISQDATSQLHVSGSGTSPSIEKFFKGIANMKPCVKKEDKISPFSINSIGTSLLETIALPNQKDEAWRFTNLGKLFSSFPFGQSWLMPTISEEELFRIIDPSAYHILIIDGILRDGMCNAMFDETSKSCELQMDWTNGDEDITNHVDKDKYLFVPETNALPRESFGSGLLTILNMAGTEGILHIKVPKDVKVSKPLQILYGSTVGTSIEDTRGMFTKVIVEMEEGSNLRLKESHFSIMRNKVNPMENNIINSVSNFVCSNVRCILSKNSALQHSIFQDYSQSSRHCEVISAELMENSRYDVRILQAGSIQSRLNIHVNLTEQCSNCTIFGAALSSDYQVLDVHSTVLHNAKETLSNQKHHILAGEFGRAVYKGHIRIPANGQKSDASQQCRSILLGKNVKVQVMPTLEIIANDVSCSHGATVADVDPDSVLFLKMRGLSYETARQILTKSYIFSMFEDVSMDDSLRQRILQRISHLSSKPAEQTNTSNEKKEKCAAL